MKSWTLPTTLAAGLLALATTLPVQAGLLTIGLQSNGQLVSFDSETPGSMTNLGSVTGIVDIDYFGPNRELYGISATGVLYRINPLTGALTVAADGSANYPGGTTITNMDFNPVADRARVYGVVGSTQTNFRMVPDVITAPSPAGTAGAVTNDGAFSLFGGGTYGGSLVSSAYTNPADGASSTTLYSLGTTTGGVNQLLIHPSAGGPAFSQVTVLGDLGNNGAIGGFDIGIDGVAYAAVGSSFGTVDLTTGAFTALGALSAGLVSFAVVVPETGSAALVSAGLAGLLLVRRRRAA